MKTIQRRTLLAGGGILALLVSAAQPVQAQTARSILDAFEGHANVQASIEDEWLVIETNGLPDHETQPVNPNTPQAIDLTVRLPLEPELQEETTETGMGPIGVMVNGVLFYNPFAAGGLDAVEHEVFDNCLGHPDERGRYHYHQAPGCLLDGSDAQLIGFAFDGFGLYSYTDESGEWPEDLDECNGHFGVTPEYPAGSYHYHVTSEFPYLIGCFHGEVQTTGTQAGSGGGAAQPPAGSDANWIMPASPPQGNPNPGPRGPRP